MKNLNNFDTVQLIQSLTVINEGGENQDFLIEQGSIELIQDIEEGTFSTYFTNNDGECDYVCTTQTFSMAGDLSKVLTEVNKSI